MSMAVERLRSLIKSSGKTGYKASIYISTLAKLASLASESLEMVRKARCLAASKGKCRSSGSANFCVVGCAHINYLEYEGRSIIWKYKSGTGSIIIEESRLEFNTSKAKLILEPRKLVVTLSSYGGGVASEVDITNVDEVIKHNYDIRVAHREASSLVSNISRNLTMCARASALTC